MIDLKNINNNILSNRWKERYEKLSDEIKEKLDNLNNADISDYQLQVIKRKRIYLEIGDTKLYIQSVYRTIGEKYIC